MPPTPWLLSLVLPIALAAAPPARPIAADEKGELLLAATRKGDLAEVRRLLDAGADVNARTRYASTPLFFACDRGHLEIARLLIERGADVNVKDNFYNATALTWAMSKKHAAIVSLLIEKGVDVSDALRQSVQGGDQATFDLILAKGKVTQAALDEALLVATTLPSEKNAAMGKALEERGAKALNFAVDEATLKSYEGRYSEADTNMTFQVKEGKLNFVTPQASNVLIASARDKFKFVQAGFEFTFERDAQGNVAGVRYPSRGAETKLKKVN